MLRWQSFFKMEHPWLQSTAPLLSLNMGISLVTPGKKPPHSRKSKSCLSLNTEKKSNSIVVTLVAKRNDQCEEAYNRWLQQQSRLPPSSLDGGAAEGVADPQEMIVEEYCWQVNKNSVKEDGCDG
jgi:hypothetical protein